MAGFDPEVFGGGGGGTGYDADVFNAPEVKTAPMPAPQAPAKPQPGMLQSALGTLQLLTPSGVATALTTPDGRQTLGNALAGGLRGAGSIGASILYPFDKGQDIINGDRASGPSRNQERRQAMDAALTNLGADPSSAAYQGSKLATEVGGTWAAGGLAGKVAGGLGASPALVNSIGSGGMVTGAKASGFVPRALDVGTRMLGGAVNSGVTAAMIDPESAPTAAAVGAVLPPTVQAAGSVGQFLRDKTQGAARSLMQSAIKPTLAQLRSGDADTAINVMLQNGISPNARGVEKLGNLADNVDQRITDAIANSNTRVSKDRVLSTLADTRARFSQQATPQADLAAIQAAEDAFRAHPLYTRPTIAVQDAQALKRGTYGVLAGKYGEQGSASTEAQKAIARGLKEQIAKAVPEVDPLNQELSQLITARQVAERRALMEGNKNPMGLAALSPSKAGLLAFLADRNAQIKALAARGLYTGSNIAPGLLSGPALVPLVRSGLLATEANP